MPRVVSFVVLVAIILLVTTLFFTVMAQFFVPLFLAAVMVVIFGPLHRWIFERCGGRHRLAAACTMLAILLIVLAPLALIFWNAYVESVEIVRAAREERQLIELRERFVAKLGAAEHQLDSLGFGRERFREASADLVARIQSLVVGGARIVLQVLFGTVIMIIAMYYFLLDGPRMIVTLMRLSPLEDRHEMELFRKFTSVSRAVVLATLLSAVVQGMLAGIGFAAAGVGPTFMLTGLTIFLAMVPFVGAAAVWIPTCIYLYLFDRTAAAIGLAVYGACVVSSIDNVIKPYVLHGQSNLHPLLALLSVLGGVASLGPIGILVGPMVVAFLQALLEMLRSELTDFDAAGRESTIDTAQATPAAETSGNATGIGAAATPPTRTPDETTAKRASTQSRSRRGRKHGRR